MAARIMFYLMQINSSSEKVRRKILTGKFLRSVFLTDHYDVDVETLHFIDMSLATRQSTRCNIPEDPIFNKRVL
jgi:hypothetical protein